MRDPILSHPRILPQSSRHRRPPSDYVQSAVRSRKEHACTLPVFFTAGMMGSELIEENWRGGRGYLSFQPKTFPVFYVKNAEWCSVETDTAPAEYNRIIIKFGRRALQYYYLYRRKDISPIVDLQLVDLVPIPIFNGPSSSTW